MIKLYEFNQDLKIRLGIEFLNFDARFLHLYQLIVSQLIILILKLTNINRDRLLFDPIRILKLHQLFVF